MGKGFNERAQIFSSMLRTATDDGDAGEPTCQKYLLYTDMSRGVSVKARVNSIWFKPLCLEIPLIRNPCVTADRHFDEHGKSWEIHCSSFTNGSNIFEDS